MSDTADDGDWMPCMTLMLQEADESPEGEENLRRYLESRLGPGRPAYTVMATVTGQFAWVKRAGDERGGIGAVCGDSREGEPSWIGLHRVSTKLVSDLSTWCATYPHSLSPTSDNPVACSSAFEARGIAFAVRLKAELGDGVQVMYRESGGDPYANNRGGTSVEIVAGTVVGMS
jgi:hypothetical protein